MKLTINTGICKLVNVNMYESVLSPSSTNIDDDLETAVLKDVITQEESETIASEIFSAFQLDKYKKALTVHAISVLKDVDYSSLPFALTITETASIDSPREYNFRGDTLDFEIEVSDDIKDTLIPWVENEFDAMFMTKNFGSYDGFTSFMPSSKEEMLKELKEGDERDLEMIVAMIMAQLLEDEKVSEYDFCDEWFTDSQAEMTEYLEDDKTPLYSAMVTKCIELELF